MNAGGLGGKMTFTSGKAFDMEGKERQEVDPTEKNSERGDAKATQVAREQESDRDNGNAPFGNISSPEGDDAGENRVTTSLSED